VQIVRLRFLSHGYKRSVLWLLKYAKIRFRSGFRPGPRWGSSRHSSRPPSRLERGHPSSYPTPLGTDPPSALAMRTPGILARSTPMVVVVVVVVVVIVVFLRCTLNNKLYSTVSCQKKLYLCCKRGR